MLIPRKAKYRKKFRGKMRGKSGRGTSLEFGEYGLKAQSRGWITSRQIEAARIAMTRYTKRGGRIWIRIFPDQPITKKPSESRMGGGKGDVEDYVVTVLPGRILFEMSGVSKGIAVEAMKRAGAKLPVKSKFITQS